MSEALRVAGILYDAETDTRTLVHFDTEHWEKLGEWCVFHGLDWKRIPAGTQIVRSVAGRRITCEYIWLDRQDQVIFHPLTRELITHIHVEQGEAPPLPFPEGGTPCPPLSS